MAIEIKYSSDDKELINTLQKMQAGLDKTARKLDQVGQRGRKAGRETSDQFANVGSQVTRSVTQMVGALTGFGGVLGTLTQLVTAFKSEHERLVRAQEQARQSGMSQGEAMREVMQTFRPDATVGGQDLMREFERISKATGGTSVKDIAIAAKDVFSVGAETNRQALDAIEAAFRVTPGKPVEATELASRAVQIAKIQGTDNFKAVIGLLTNVAEATSIRDLPQLAATAPGSAATSLATGGTAEEGLEIFSTLQQLIGDVEGRRTATASETLIAKLHEFVPAGAAEQKKGKPVRKGGALVGSDKAGEFLVPDAEVAAFEAAQGPQEKIELLRQSEGLRRLFLTEANFETRSETAVKEFLSGSRRALHEERLVQPKIGGIATPEERAVQQQAFEDYVANLNAAPFQGDVERERQHRRTVEQFELEDEFSRRTAFARKALTESLEKVDQPGLEDFPLIGGRARQMTVFEEATNRLREKFQQQGFVEFGPEEIAARVLEQVPTEGRTFPNRDMPADQQSFLQQQIRSLREQGEEDVRQPQPSLAPGGQMPADDAVAEPQAAISRDADRESLALMRQQNDLLRGLRDASGRMDDRRRRQPASAQLGRDVA